jgi:hypothetical protein
MQFTLILFYKRNGAWEDVVLVTARVCHMVMQTGHAYAVG